MSDEGQARIVIVIFLPEFLEFALGLRAYDNNFIKSIPESQESWQSISIILLIESYIYFQDFTVYRIIISSAEYRSACRLQAWFNLLAYIRFAVN